MGRAGLRFAAHGIHTPVLVLAVLVVVLWRQWFQMEALRDQLRTLEDESDERTVYEDGDGNIIEN
jgi:hypothetical protein